MHLVPAHVVIMLFGLFSIVHTMPISVHGDNYAVNLQFNESPSKLLPRKSPGPESEKERQFREELALHQAEQLAQNPTAPVPSPPRSPTGQAAEQQRTEHLEAEHTTVAHTAEHPTTHTAANTTESQNPDRPTSSDKVWITFFQDPSTTAHQVNDLQASVKQIVVNGLLQTAAFDPDRFGRRTFDYHNSFSGSTIEERRPIRIIVNDDWNSGSCGGGCLGSVAYEDVQNSRTYHARVKQLDEDDEQHEESNFPDPFSSGRRNRRPRTL
ncbi:hypothetical protein J3R30DRAFT_1126860 [Lentinula aciculospora]|uniref:Uncharacterized protein n=1 Tax=Lentinula aciculospora TaxID=153920 RepID=A0A9W9A064_9AGAR|nr:hypothetical protein J3R30DRAFT_1126860 [Lentinula aciculospora]